MKLTITFLVQLLLPAILLSQSLVSINPSVASPGLTLNVTITGLGTSFLQGTGTTVSFGFQQGSSSSVNSVTIMSETSILANITVPWSVTTGFYDVNTDNLTDGFLTLPNGLQIIAPSLVSIDPSEAPRGLTLNVTITGFETNFLQGTGTTVSFGFPQGGTSSVNSVTVLSDTSILANITVPLSIPPGFYDVHTNNTTDGFLTLPNGLYIFPPSLISIDPSDVIRGLTLNVTITGLYTNFLQGTGTTVSFGFPQGGTSSINSVTVLSDTTILANITVPLTTPPGDYDVNTDNSTDGFLTLTGGLHIGLDNIESLDANIEVLIYPNPANEMIIVESISRDNAGEIVITIFNVNGEMMLQQNSLRSKTEIDISTLVSGLYLLRVESRYGIAMKKFVAGFPRP